MLKLIKNTAERLATDVNNCWIVCEASRVGRRDPRLIAEVEILDRAVKGNRELKNLLADNGAVNCAGPLTIQVEVVQTIDKSMDAADVLPRLSLEP